MLQKLELSLSSPDVQRKIRLQPRARSAKLVGLTVILLSALVVLFQPPLPKILFTLPLPHPIPVDADSILRECAALKLLPGAPASFPTRLYSDRYEDGTKPYLIRNATIWTGSDDGREVIRGDVLLENGLIRAVGNVSISLDTKAIDRAIILDAHGAWLTPGLFDLHSHMAVRSVPKLLGTNDTNSVGGLVVPWMRSIDGINVHDDSIGLARSGGVTSALILPGSASAIGGQAFVMKLRRTRENSPSSMILEPPFLSDPQEPPRWRHLKHATGEIPSRVYSGTRMDTIWAMRSAYEQARILKDAQDEYCTRAEAGLWHELSASGFPKSLEWEALVDVLRGKVKVNIHAYSPGDFDSLVQLSNEFQFHVSVIHHAHDAYFVTPLLERFYGGKPAIALFATQARYQLEAYHGSEFSPKILNDHGFRVILKTDHPLIDSRYLAFEAAQSHIYGLPANKAIQSVITTPADVAGYGHRLGHVKVGYDADIVLWDSHPLSIGAIPKQVFIDGIPQLDNSTTVEKSDVLQKLPSVPDWSKEAADALRFQGLQPLTPRRSIAKGGVVFTNIRKIWAVQKTGGGSTIRKWQTPPNQPTGVAHFDTLGRLICTSFPDEHPPCPPNFEPRVEVVDLKGGSLSPPLISFGGNLGISEIDQEPSTKDGVSNEGLTRAVDGLSFQGREVLLAYRAGVTISVTAPESQSIAMGISVAFNNGASHKAEQGVIICHTAAFHVQLSTQGEQPSVSMQVAYLRSLLLSPNTTWAHNVVRGKMPIIVHVNNADIIASVLLLKEEVEARWNTKLKLGIFGGLEAHLLAKEIATQNVAVIVSPTRAFPMEWGSRRILPGPPLSRETLISTLLAQNVTVGVGIEGFSRARRVRYDLSWISLETGGGFSDEKLLALGSINIAKVFGLEHELIAQEFVAYLGGDIFDTAGKVAGVASRSRGRVDLW